MCEVFWRYLLVGCKWNRKGITIMTFSVLMLLKVTDHNMSVIPPDEALICLETVTFPSPFIFTVAINWLPWISKVTEQFPLIFWPSILQVSRMIFPCANKTNMHVLFIYLGQSICILLLTKKCSLAPFHILFCNWFYHYLTMSLNGQSLQVKQLPCGIFP